MQYCSLQHQTLLLSPVSSTTGCCFCFGSISSFFLELFLHWSPVAYLAPTDLGGSSFSVLSFCLFILFTGFFRQEYWSDLPFPSPVEHILSELSTMTHPSWLAQCGMTNRFIELDNAVAHVIRLVESSDKMWSTGEGNANHFSIPALRNPWTVWKGKKIGHWKMNSPGLSVPTMLQEISGVITPERMKRQSQSKNNPQL